MLLKKLLPEVRGLKWVSYSLEDDLVTVRLRSTASRSRCPACARSGRRVHSRYTRRVADVPCLGRGMIFVLEVRRFKCDNGSCHRRTFAERLGPMIEVHARRTSRLRRQQESVSLVLSAQEAARLSARLRIGVSASTFLRVIRKIPLPVATAKARCIGVDDWAYRRGRRYGTLIVDLERRRPIDVLPDREGTTLAAWLKDQPQIELVTRDRYKAFAEAVATAAPQAIQVADRFHLLCNLGDMVERVLQSQTSALQSAASVPATEDSEPENRRKESVSNQASSPVTPRQARRQVRFDEVLRLRQLGWTQNRIGQQLHLSTKTVRRYLASRTLSSGRRPNVTSSVTPYEPYLRQRWQEGCQNGRQLWRELRDQGFAGNYESVRRMVSRLRQGDGRRLRYRPPVPPAPPQPLSPRQAKWLFTKSRNDLLPDQAAYLDRLIGRTPELAQVYDQAQAFVGLVERGDLDAFEQWLASTREHSCRVLRLFAAGIERDRDAIEAGLVMVWSNGQLEGQVNRLKVIKRMMYGRANFDLLRRRVLLASA